MRWFLKVTDSDTDMAALRALAGCAAWFALGGPAPESGTYPDVYAAYRSGLSFPAASTPIDLITAIARITGNDGVDYCLRAAIAVVRPDLALSLPEVTDASDPWFVGVVITTKAGVEMTADEANTELIWLGGPVVGWNAEHLVFGGGSDSDSEAEIAAEVDTAATDGVRLDRLYTVCGGCH